MYKLPLVSFVTSIGFSDVIAIGFSDVIAIGFSAVIAIGDGKGQLLNIWKLMVIYTLHQEIMFC